ncbi:MAG: redoxin domain-containing protein [Candidatus Bathyarchaeota archaeon]|nr:redoxin domain-containing protein [Candidatus Bathyarchaeota archaeon]
MMKDLLKAVYSADFTPVCTTEFIAFPEIFDGLKKRNTELLCLSVDSAYSHIAWIRNVKENKGLKIPCPIIADFNVSKEFGMIYHARSKTETIRCFFVMKP